jgi:hypothetical protein
MTCTNFWTCCQLTWVVYSSTIPSASNSSRCVNSQKSPDFASTPRNKLLKSVHCTNPCQAGWSGSVPTCACYMLHTTAPALPDALQPCLVLLLV